MRRTSCRPTTRPDVFIAEPVGSCTDLKATVDYPLRRIYGDDFTHRPAERHGRPDPRRARSWAWNRASRSPRKSSTSTASSWRRPRSSSSTRSICCRRATGATDRRAANGVSGGPRAGGLGARGAWHRRVDRDRWTIRRARTSGAMEVDYETYAEGEALLGWLNCTARVESAERRSTATPCCCDIAVALQAIAGVRRRRDRPSEADADAG